MKYTTLNLLNNKRSVVDQHDMDNHKSLLHTGLKDINGRDFVQGDFLQELASGDVFILNFGCFKALADDGIGFYIETFKAPARVFPFSADAANRFIVVGDIYTCREIFRARNRDWLKIRVDGYNKLVNEEL